MGIKEHMSFEGLVVHDGVSFPVSGEFFVCEEEYPVDRSFSVVGLREWDGTFMATSPLHSLVSLSSRLVIEGLTDGQIIVTSVSRSGKCEFKGTGKAPQRDTNEPK